MGREIDRERERKKKVDTCHCSRSYARKLLDEKRDRNMYRRVAERFIKGIIPINLLCRSSGRSGKNRLEACIRIEYDTSNAVFLREHFGYHSLEQNDSLVFSLVFGYKRFESSISLKFKV